MHARGEQISHAGRRLPWRALPSKDSLLCSPSPIKSVLAMAVSNKTCYLVPVHEEVE